MIACVHRAVIFFLAVLLSALWPTGAEASHRDAATSGPALTRKTTSWPETRLNLGHQAFTDKTAIVFFDGNGNITALTDTNANVVARAEYDPYGRMLALTGPMAAVNHYWFSSKEYIPAAGLYDFGGRFEDPNLARWPNRDPIGEMGGINLYSAMGNDPVNMLDPYGLYWEFFGLGFGQTATYMRANGTVGYGTPPSEQAPGNPTTYGAMRASLIGDPNDNNFNGLTGGQVVQNGVQQSVEQLGQYAAMAAFPEGEGAKAAEEAAAAAKAARAAAKCEKAAQKIKNILANNLKPGPKGDIAGAISDMVGNPIPKPGGGTWDHTQDLGNILRGLQNNVDALQNATDPNQIATRQQAQQAIQQIQQAIKGAGL